MSTPEKEKQVAEITENLGRANSVILTDFSGSTVKQISDLRRRLRKQNAVYRVFKNTLVARVVKDKPYEKITKHLNGTTGIVLGFGDPVEPLKILKEFEPVRKVPIRVGVIEGLIYDPADLARIREIPPLPVMRATFLGVLKAPERNLVSLLAAPARGLLTVLKAHADKASA